MTKESPKADALRQMREKRAEDACKAMIEDGAPAAIVRPPMTPEQRAALERSVTKAISPNRKLKNPSDRAVTGLGAELKKHDDADVRPRFLKAKTQTAATAAQPQTEKPMITKTTNPASLQVPTSSVQAAMSILSAGKTSGEATPPIGAPTPESVQIPPQSDKAKAKKTPAKPKSVPKKKATKAPGKPAGKPAKQVKASKAKPAKKRQGVPALDVAAFMVKAGEKGVAMADLEKRFGIDAHPMRAKIFYVRHTLGWTVKTKEGRYFATAPAAKA